MNKLTLVVVTAGVAFCSIVYELLMAQSLSAIMGDTLLRYNTTIGVYIASMGVGALAYERWRRPDLGALLIGIELTLAVLGLMAPVLVVAFDYGLRSFSSHLDPASRSLVLQTSRYAFNYALIMLIGMLSGMELPLLMELGDRLKAGFGNVVLAIDYGGTLVGAIAFPMILLPDLGLFQTAAIAGLVNALLAAWLLGARRKLVPTHALAAVVLALTAWSFLFHGQIERFVVDRIYMQD